MAKKSDKEIAAAGVEKADKLKPQVRKKAALPVFDWALSPVKLGLATTYVDNTYSGLTSEERHERIKERYIELKGRLPGEKRHKDGMHETGKPRPTSEQAIRYDEGMTPGKPIEEDDDDDDEDVLGTVEEEL